MKRIEYKPTELNLRFISLHKERAYFLNKDKQLLVFEFNNNPLSEMVKDPLSKPQQPVHSSDENMIYEQKEIFKYRLTPEIYQILDGFVK